MILTLKMNRLNTRAIQNLPRSFTCTIKFAYKHFRIFQNFCINVYFMLKKIHIRKYDRYTYSLYINNKPPLKLKFFKQKNQQSIMFYISI